MKGEYVGRSGKNKKKIMKVCDVLKMKDKHITCGNKQIDKSFAEASK